MWVQVKGKERNAFFLIRHLGRQMPADRATLHPPCITLQPLRYIAVCHYGTERNTYTMQLWATLCQVPRFFVHGELVLPALWSLFVASGVCWGARGVMKTHYLCSADPLAQMAGRANMRPLNFGTLLVHGSAFPNS